ncbi:MAG: FAD-dependent oxidoreductase [Ectothiorhodospiraceae bacterium]|nr:FAD-dependent oxidoreductase [Chromatiales bacterium]MCP5154026.1 FAD-dependent oxidoreductase [Ectothiorhodospiraceae bacterium]
MSRDPRYDILFEPVAIGPKTARNRFYQPGHCNGMGRLRPAAHARMRGVKAEGGWAVVHTEHCGIHPSAEMYPEVVLTLWDDRDMPVLAAAADAVHEHGGLFGVQLAYSGGFFPNRLSREVPIGPADRPVPEHDPVQARAIDKRDIVDLHRWWRAAVDRAVRAGADVINVSGQYSTLVFHLLSPRNRRTDEYGGSIENRSRLLRELIEIARDASKGTCAVTVRVIIDELIGDRGLRAHVDGREMIEHLAEVPDLWDVVIGTWEGDSAPSRFAGENVHEPYFAFLKSVTSRPVVGVGRFTSPDTMASLVRRGVLDMVGAARPSIADPFLPRKIEEGRVDDIRECIGCNICVSGHFTAVNYRCTQNPTAGEEHRRGWHPETIPARGSDARLLVVGGGPAGLEAARALGQRGYAVVLAEAGDRLGGRINRESRLPGLAEWARVRDWRVGQLHKMANVETYLGSALDASHVRELAPTHVVVATGARWRRDGYGRRHDDPLPGSSAGHVYGPDDILDGVVPDGPVLVYDDDHYYMGNLVAEVLRRAGREVTLVTPASDIAAFTRFTLELERVARHLAELGVETVTHHEVTHIDADRVVLRHVHTERERVMPVASVVLVTARLPNDALYRELVDDSPALHAAGIESVTRIGDCEAPGAIVHATFAGHRYARELDGAPQDRLFRHELPSV